MNSSDNIIPLNLSLYDQIALEAMRQILAKEHGVVDPEILGKMCYAIADGMIKARNEKQP